jgi:hypothetical protein
MRQAWINKLRERISEYIARCIMLHIDLQASGTTTGTDGYRKLLEIKEEILLLLHKGESDHDAIAEKVIAVSTWFGKPPTGGVFDNLLFILIELREITQKVLKDEWEVTKKMESKTLAL